MVRSSRAEERANALWERKKQDCVEVLYSQVRKELSQEETENMNVKGWHIPNAEELSNICSGEHLAQMLEQAPDPASVEVMLFLIYLLRVNLQTLKSYLHKMGY